MTNTLTTPSLQMTWMQAPWDQAVCGFPVLQITSMKAHGADAGYDMKMFELERDRLGAGLVSCRLPHDCLTESMLLEDHGFRFIEMLYAPELDLSTFNPNEQVDLLTVIPAREDDLPLLLNIAGTSFHNERFTMDHRLDYKISANRYQNWVVSSFRHPTQKLHVICDGTRKIAFFITEALNYDTCYWHLNAIAPDEQGKGYGRRVWLSMLDHASGTGARRVLTSIVARNHRVLNLYASLGFQFSPPAMTFHWIRPGV